MAYATHADIEAAVAGRAYTFGAGTKPTDTEVDNYCDQISQELDGVLKQAGYVTPVVDADALKPLKLYCCYGVVPLVEISRTPDEIEGAERDIAAFYSKLYKDALERIRQHQLDAPMSSTATGGIGSWWNDADCEDEDKEPMFKKEDRY
jgi:hypothetical protein